MIIPDIYDTFMIAALAYFTNYVFDLSLAHSVIIVLILVLIIYNTNYSFFSLPRKVLVTAKSYARNILGGAADDFGLKDDEGASFGPLHDTSKDNFNQKLAYF